MPKERLLITGASGLLGYALCLQAEQAYDVYGTCFKNEVMVPGVKPVKIDLAGSEQIAQCFQEINPQAVIHTAAFSNPNDCEQQPEKSERINLTATIHIARFCAASKIPLVFTSSDLAFNGEDAPYHEDGPVSPICVYGRHKVAAEKAVQKICPAATICRMPLMLGGAPDANSGFLAHMVRTLRKKEQLLLFTDEFRTAVDTDSAATGLLMALKHPGAILHLGGRRRLSRFSMGCLVADVLETDHALLKPMLAKDLPMPAPRSPDVSLSSERAYALGYAPQDLASYLERTVPRIVL